MQLADIVKQAQLLDEGFIADTKQLVQISEAILKTYTEHNNELTLAQQIINNKKNGDLANEASPNALPTGATLPELR